MGVFRSPNNLYGFQPVLSHFRQNRVFYLWSSPPPSSFWDISPHDLPYSLARIDLSDGGHFLPFLHPSLGIQSLIDEMFFRNDTHGIALGTLIDRILDLAAVRRVKPRIRALAPHNEDAAACEDGLVRHRAPERLNVVLDRLPAPKRKIASEAIYLSGDIQTRLRIVKGAPRAHVDSGLLALLARGAL